MKLQRITSGIVVFIMLSLLLAGCGASGPPTTLNVDLADFSFKPNTFTVPAGKELTVTVNNKGANVHEFVIMKKGMQATPPFDEDDEGNILWEIDNVAAGTSKTDKVTVSEPGTYQIVCGTPNHIELGMLGTLTAQ